MRRDDRSFVVGGVGRTQAAEERASLRDRELETVAEISNALARARTPVDVARPLVRRSRRSSASAFAGVGPSSTERDEATGLYAELEGERAAFWESVRLDLRNEPSGIASAVFAAAPVTVYDIASSPLVSPRLAASSARRAEPGCR